MAEFVRDLWRSSSPRPLLKAGITTAGCPGPWLVWFWICPRRRTPQPLWETCDSFWPFFFTFKWNFMCFSLCLLLCEILLRKVFPCSLFPLLLRFSDWALSDSYETEFQVQWVPAIVIRRLVCLNWKWKFFELASSSLTPCAINFL